MPTGIYTIPEASFVGETEETLIERKIPYIVGRCRYSDIPRGEIIADDVGFLKLLYHRDDRRLLGVHVMGEQATEVVHLGLLGDDDECYGGSFQPNLLQLSNAR